VFLLWLGLGVLLLAAGAALLGWAGLEKQEPAIVAHEVEGAGVLLRSCGIFRCADTFDPTAWYVAGSLLVVAAAAPFALAARRR
jgi:hypothetical protein